MAHHVNLLANGCEQHAARWPRHKLAVTMASLSLLVGLLISSGGSVVDKIESLPPLEKYALEAPCAALVLHLSCIKIKKTSHGVTMFSLCKTCQKNMMCTLELRTNLCEGNSKIVYKYEGI